MKVFKTIMNGFGGLFIRLSLGAYFIWAGLVKIHKGVDGFAESAYTNAEWLYGFPHERIDENLHMIFLKCLPFLEVLFGFLFAAGLLMPVASLGMLGIIASIMIGKTLQGTLDKPLTQMPPFDKNILITAMILAILFNGGGIFKLDTLLFGWMKSRKSTKTLPEGD